MKIIHIIGAVVLTALLSPKCLSHSEDNKVRYVAQTGQDNSNCSSPVRPCKTLRYAMQQTSKGDNIRVGEGNYQIEDSETLGYFVNNIISITGGYSAIDLFRHQSPQQHPTALTGVPPQFRKTLTKRGFNLIADGKQSRQKAFIKSRLSLLTEQHQATTCKQGTAAGFPCQSVDLVSHIPLPSDVTGNDIWGHTDANTGVEYALMGYSDGVRIYSLADHSEPLLITHVPGSNILWRDIKVYQFFDQNRKMFRSYAYISSESSTNKLQIIDLTLLPETVTVLPPAAIHTKAHNLFIGGLDYAFNLPLHQQSAELHATGANTFAGAATRYTLTDPAAPELISAPQNSAGYAHDNTQMVVKGEQAAAACNGESLCNLLVDFNEDKVKLWDIGGDSSRMVGEFTYTDVTGGQRYVHSGWPTEDGQYIFVHDELDERNAGLPTTIRILSIADPTTPTLAKQWQGPTDAIDHNGFVRGNRYYFSNYERGMTILDISDPAEPESIGFFDTFPSSDNANFNGAWGVYPFLPSGHILVSDLNSGFYVVKPHQTANETVAFQQQAVAINDNQTIDVTIKRQALGESFSAGASLYIESLAASAVEGSDYVHINEKITFDNDKDLATVTIKTLPSSNNIGANKHFYLRLRQLSPSLQLGDISYLKVSIGDANSPGMAFASVAEKSVSESNNTMTVSVSRIGGANGELTVYYRTQPADSDDISNTEGTIQWQDGETQTRAINITIADDNLIEEDEVISLQLAADAEFSSIIDTVTVTIIDDDSNTSPVVNAGQDIEMVTDNVYQLSSAIASDADSDDELSFAWTQLSGPSVTLANSASLTDLEITTGEEVGEVVLQISVTDQHGAVATDTVTVTILEAEVTPLPTVPETRSSGGSMGWLVLLLLLSLGMTRKMRHHLGMGGVRKHID